MTKITDPFQQGVERGTAIFNELFPFRVLKANDLSSYGLSPYYEVLSAFTTEELAIDFIKYQKTKNPSALYRIVTENKGE